MPQTNSLDALTINPLPADAPPLPMPEEGVAVVDSLLREAESHLYSNPAKSLPLALEAVRLAKADGYLFGVASGLTLTGRLNLRLYRLDDAESHLTEALYLATELGNTQIKGRAMGILGTVHLERGNFPLALSTLRNALSLSREAEDEAGAFLSLNAQGRLYDLMGQQDSALGMFQQALGNSRARNNALDEALVLLNMGVMYWNRSDSTNSISWTQKALDILRTLDALLLRGMTLANLSGIFLDIGQFAQARRYADEFLTLDSGRDDQRFMTTGLNNLGKILIQEGNNKAADVAFERSLRITRNLGDENSRIATLVEWGSSYLERGESADFVRAKELLEEAVQSAERIGVQNLLYRAHQFLAELHERQGDLAPALRHYKEFHAIKENVFNEKSERQIQNLMVIMELENTRFADRDDF